MAPNAQFHNVLMVPNNILRNPTIYEIPRIFHNDSKMHRYLAYKVPHRINMDNRQYNLLQVMQALRTVIHDERLYDPLNTTCLWADNALTEAIGMKACHVTEIRGIIADQMRVVNGYEAFNDDVTNQSQPSSFNRNGLYAIANPKFAAALRETSVFNEKPVYTYMEICEAVSAYVLERKDDLFDKRNIKIVFAHGTTIGEAFKVNIFHRNQVNTLIQRQIKEVDPTTAIGEAFNLIMNL